MTKHTVSTLTVLVTEQGKRLVELEAIVAELKRMLQAHHADNVAVQRSTIRRVEHLSDRENFKAALTRLQQQYPTQRSFTREQVQQEMQHA